jgi:hypothetical protein
MELLKIAKMVFNNRFKSMVIKVMAITGMSILFTNIYAALPQSINSDTVQTKEENNLLSTGFDYKSNNSAFGQISSQVKQPVIAPFVGYISAKGFLASAYFNRIQNSDTTETKPTNEAELSAGYAFSFFYDKFSITPTYTHYFASANSQSITSMVKSQFALDFTYSLKHFTATLGPALLKGDNTDFTLTSLFSVPFEFEEFISKKGELSISPSVGFNFGQFQYEDNLKVKNAISIIDKIKSRFPRLDIKIGQMKDATRRAKLETISKDILGEPLNDNETLSSLLNRLDKATAPRFSLTSVSFSLPITYSYGNLDFNFSLNTNNPVELKLKNGKNKLVVKAIQYFIGFGVNYNFSW